MKITAFILSILLSTIALAEDHAYKYSDVNMEEIIEQVMIDIDDEIIDVEDKGGTIESVEAVLGRELTEEEKDSIFSNIDELEAAHSEANHQDNIPKDNKHVPKMMEVHETKKGRLPGWVAVLIIMAPAVPYFLHHRILLLPLLPLLLSGYTINGA